MMKDPTQTNPVRQAWLRQYNRRFSTFQGRIDVFFAQAPTPLPADFVQAFDNWYAETAADIFGGAWQDRYITQSYARGVLLSDIPTGINQVHADTIKLLQGQATRDLDALLVASRAQAVDKVAKGIVSGTAKTGIKAEVKDRVSKIGLTRGRLIANTMAPYTSNMAEVKSAEIVGDSLGAPIDMLWITRQDERVRTTHALRNRKIYSEKVAANLLGEPNCRCRVRPVLVANTPRGYDDIRTRIRESGLALSEAAQRDRSFWTVQANRAEGM